MSNPLDGDALPSRVPSLRVLVVLITLAPVTAAALSPADIDAAAVVAEDVELVAILADDVYAGRDNNTPQSAAVRAILIDELKEFARGYAETASGEQLYEMPFTAGAIGTNLVAFIQGSEIPTEIVMIGAHYDHIGTSSEGIFNGATDNATGVAVAVAVGRAIASLPVRPRRSILLALWDAEEDGLVGSRTFSFNPPFPQASIVAYVNLDILGTNLLPSLHGTSFAFGSESGGAELRSLIQAALANEGMAGTRLLSRRFGQDRSDHAVFIDSIPSVFVSDWTGTCYHTTEDDIDIVDLQKLKKQARFILRLVVALAETSTPPALEPTMIIDTTFEDALAVQAVLDGAVADLALFAPDQQTILLAEQAVVHAIVADGPAAYDSTLVGRDLSFAATRVWIALSTVPCDGFLVDEPIPIGPVVPVVVVILAAALLCRRRGLAW